MEFRTLRAFVEVVRQGGFSQAAKTVFATQSYDATTLAFDFDVTDPTATSIRLQPWEARVYRRVR